MERIWPQQNAIFHNNYVRSCIKNAIKVMTFLADIAALCVIVGAILEFGFVLTERLENELNLVYFWAWNMFLIERISKLVLTKRGHRKSAYNLLGWGINGLLTLTLIPIFVEFFNIDDTIGVMRMVGSGVLLMPRCIQPGVHLSWIDSLFTTTSAVCVTGLTTIDVPSTFTSFGQLVIMVLIQIGGLGMMTITSFFALFFMGNTSIYNQMLVSDMVSSKSLASLWSTLLNIFGFTAILEFAGAVSIFLNIHGAIGLDFWHELFFSVFHAVSAFCNAGFSNYPDGMGAPVLLQGGHCWLYVILALLVILGGIGYPVLVNLRIAAERHATVIWKWINGRHYASLSIPNLFDLNTKIVLRTTTVLIVLGTMLLAYFEWNNTFAGMRIHEKVVQAFFNAVSPRTAGFISVNLNSMCIQSIFIYTMLMWIGGASQSTAGGVKVNAFAVAFLNIRSIIRGTNRVEFAGRELSTDSIRRANAAVFSSLIVLGFFIFMVTLTDPDLPLKAIVFECVSAFATVGSSLGITSELQEASKLLIVALMFLGRVGVVTLAQGLLKQYKNQNYKLPQDNITIS